MTKSTYKRQRGLYPRRCTKCGVPKGAASFAPRGGRTPGSESRASVCRPCANRYRRNLPSQKPRHAAASAKAHKKRNDASRLRAVRGKSQEWTSIELAIAARDDLSVDEVVRMVGRSVSAVGHARHRIKSDPRYARLAGLDDDAARLADPGVINIAPRYAEVDSAP